MLARKHREVLALPEAGFVTHTLSEALNRSENQGVAPFILKLQELRLDGLVAPATVLRTEALRDSNGLQPLAMTHNVPRIST